MAALHHRLQRGKDLLVREVAGRAVEDERVAARGAHRALRSPGCFSRWPPNSKRMAERSLSAKSASPRELKRSNSAVVSTGTGTASSIAALIVQRPSPESDTRPAKPCSAGSLTSAEADRSSSQEAMTLPRRQTSAISGRSKSYW